MLLGSKHSKSAREKNRQAHLGTLLGEKNPSKRTEVREKIRQSKLGRRWTKAIRNKISQSRLGQRWSKEQRQKQSGANSHRWRGGISFEPYSVDWTETLKRAIRERDNYICQLCNCYGYTVHHIDYNKKNCNPNNLITLCKKCHAKTNYNREYWIKLFKNE